MGEEDNSSNSKVNVNVNITGSVKDIGTGVGVGVGIAQVVKAVPPQAKAGVAIGLGAITGSVILAKDIIENSNIKTEVTTSDLTSISRPCSPIESGDKELRSPLESGIFDNLSSDLQLLCCVLVILLVIIYLLIGLIISFIMKNYMESKVTKWIQNKPYITKLYNWFKGSNNITMLVVMGIIMYGLIASIVIIYYIFKLKGVI